MNAGRYLEEVRDTLADVAAQRVRALLTLLGVIIGVGTLVFLSSLVAGAGQFLQQQAQTASGADLISVTGHWDQARREWNQVDRRDARALARGTRSDGTLVLGTYRSRVQLGRRRGQRVYAIGARPESQAMYTLAVARGRFLTQVDLWAQTRVAVLGAEAATRLLPGVADPLGQEVQLRGHRFRIVGVLAPKPTMAKGNRWTWDTSVVVPEPAYLANLATSQEIEEIVVKVPAARLAAEGTAALVRKLEAILGVRHPGPHPFEVRDPGAETGFARLIRFITLGLEASVAGVCLGVGGINLMNIMLVTVAQRRREIGIRRSLGATKGAIQRQFLIEAGVLAAVGGLLGIGCGSALAWLVALAATAMWGPWPFVPAPWAMGLGLTAAIATGLGFGWYPARQAAELKPIDCLRAD